MKWNLNNWNKESLNKESWKKKTFIHALTGFEPIMMFERMMKTVGCLTLYLQNILSLKEVILWAILNDIAHKFIIYCFSFG